MKNHFISYDKADFIGDDTQNKVFELMAICIADGTRIIIEREEKKGRRYLMVDFSPTDKSNTNFIMDNYVCAITSVEGDDEGDISEDFANYLDACRWLADFISKGDFTEIHIETYQREAMTMNEQERQRIGRRIAEIRKEKGLSQVQLAELCGTHQGHIARIELGKYSVGLDTLANIAEALGCKIDITEK